MGDQRVSERPSEVDHRAFLKSLLADVHALEQMLETDLIEDGPRRIGAEQEMFLVDDDLRPATVAMDVLASASDPRLTTELALFNLEGNSSPKLFTGTCLRELEAELQDLLRAADEAARHHSARVLLTGILPTLRRGDLTLHNMTPIPRYRALNDALLQQRGDRFRVYIRGIDELDMLHDNVMAESCNTSFQLHFQVAPSEFARLHNVAQLITGPVLAAAVNSPLFLGSRLWHETRVALFGSSIDDRSVGLRHRGLRPRVSFGNEWTESSVLEIFREQIARFRVILSTPTDGDPLKEVQAGRAPPLRALCLHNGTVYRWNRACYGLSPGGRAHLRIENRVLPSGPTVLDEMANAAFYFGLMSAVTDEVGDPKEQMPFHHAKDNFLAAARHGLKAQLTWADHRTYRAVDLIRDQLLPLAREGLARSGLDADDVDRYLSVIEQRVDNGRTGARWVLESLDRMGQQGTPERRHRRVVEAMLAQQDRELPVHQWPLAMLSDVEEEELRRSYRVVRQFMSVDLFTVRETDLVDLAASVMDWEHIKHVPVEDGEGRLVGLVTHRRLLRLVARGHIDGVVVRDIMVRDPLTVEPETTTLEAMKLMRERNVSCLPVVEPDGSLVGIITEADLIAVSARLLERFLGDASGPSA